MYRHDHCRDHGQVLLWHENPRQKVSNWQEIPSYMHGTGQQERWQLPLRSLGIKAWKVSGRLGDCTRVSYTRGESQEERFLKSVSFWKACLNSSLKAV